MRSVRSAHCVLLLPSLCLPLRPCCVVCYRRWGYAYLATNSARVQTAVQAYSNQARAAFAANTPLPPTDVRKPRAAQDEWPGSILVLNYGTVSGAAVSDYVVFAWDDVYTMFYFHEMHQPLWRHEYKGSVGAMLAAAFSDYEHIRSMCERFDEQELIKLTAAGGAEYATYTALAHRQATGATVAVWNEARQSVWAYMKEISSDGDVSVSQHITSSTALVDFNFS